jgi:hypothetical protein
MAITGKKEEVNNVINKMPSNPIPNYMYKNLGGLQFSDAGKEWGLATPSFSNGAVYADLDNDGDLDLVVNNVNQKAFIYRNNSRELYKNNYVAISLIYKSPNKFAIGSTIKVYRDNEIISREVMPSRGFQSSVDYRQTIGLGNKKADSITITWPDRTITSIIAPAINKLHTIDYASVSKQQFLPSSTIRDVLFEKVIATFDRHTEDDHVDFYFERNIPFMLSKQGPKKNPNLLDEISAGRKEFMAKFQPLLESNDKPINPYRVIGDLR